jgi:hypothetical protein
MMKSIPGLVQVGVFAGLLAACGDSRDRSNTARDRAVVQAMNAEQLTRAWQLAHCPSAHAANLDEIALPGGRIADVEILDLPGKRIYLPRPWTTNTRYFHGESPDGMSLRTGGAGTFEPWLGPGSDSSCRGQIFQSIRGRRDDDPRFIVELVFPRYSTGTPDGHFEVRPTRLPYAQQVATFAFFGPENLRPDDVPMLKLTPERLATERQLGDGWNVVDRNKHSLYRRLAFDARAKAAGEPVARAAEVLEGWSLIFPIENNVMAQINVDSKVPPSRWRPYAERARQIYRWLGTRPRERGTLSPSL